MLHTVIKFRLMMFCEFTYHFIKTQLSYAYQKCFELLCNVCYWKFLLIVDVVGLHYQTLISWGAKCYFSKLVYQLFLVQCFWKTLKTINVQFFSHFWSLKCRTFFRMALLKIFRVLNKTELWICHGYVYKSYLEFQMLWFHTPQ